MSILIMALPSIILTVAHVSFLISILLYCGVISLTGVPSLAWGAQTPGTLAWPTHMMSSGEAPSSRPLRSCRGRCLWGCAQQDAINMKESGAIANMYIGFKNGKFMRHGDNKERRKLAGTR